MYVMSIFTKCLGKSSWINWNFPFYWWPGAGYLLKWVGSCPSILMVLGLADSEAGSVCPFRMES